MTRHLDSSIIFFPLKYLSENLHRKEKEICADETNSLHDYDDGKSKKLRDRPIAELVSAV